MKIPRHVPDRQNMTNMTLQQDSEGKRKNVLKSVLVLHGESIETTGLEFEQPVSPVRPGDPKVMDGASEDPKWGSI